VFQKHSTNNAQSETAITINMTSLGK